MVTADIVSDHVVIAAADDHLSDAASRMLARRAQHCVVVDDSKRRALGLIRFVDVAARTSAASRTLADLNPDVPPLKVGAEDPAEEFAALLEKNDIGEAVVEGTDGGYVGRVTVESAFKWMLGEVRS